MKKLREDFIFGIRHDGYYSYSDVYFHCSCGKSTKLTRKEYYAKRGSFKCDECDNTIFKEVKCPSKPMKSVVHGIYDVVDKDDKSFTLNKTEIIAEFKKNEGSRDFEVDFYEGKKFTAIYSIKGKQLEVFREGKPLAEERWGEFFRGGLKKEALLKLISNKQNEKLYQHALTYFLPTGLTGSQKDKKWFIPLKMIFENPQLEVLSACGFSDLRYAMSHIENDEATKPNEMLGVSKVVFNIIKDMEYIGYEYIEELKMLEHLLNGNGLKSLVSIFKDESNMGTLFRCTYDIRRMYERGYRDVSKLATYITREVKLQQGISRPDYALQYLYDYVKMQIELGRDFDKFPKSLKKEHDIAMMNYDAKKDEIKAVKFKAVIEEEGYQSLCYEGDKDDEYCIVIPESSEKLINEGSSLSHCVASYVSEVIDRKCQIVFLRCKEELEESLVTIEVRGSSVRQVRGKHNRSATEKEKLFVSKWAAEKGIEYQLNY